LPYSPVVVLTEYSSYGRWLQYGFSPDFSRGIFTLSMAPTRRSFLFGTGAAAVGLTLGEEGVRAEEKAASIPAASGPSADFLTLNGPIKP
jgi:hypothetical protein